MSQHVLLASGWAAGEGSALSRVSPSDGEMVWDGASASPAQVDRAVSDARSAQADWAERSQADRNEIMLRYAERLKEKAEDLAIAISRSTGKLLWESKTEASAMAGKVGISIKSMEARAGASDASTDFGRLELRHRPHGVMAVLGPFNFPGHLPNGHIVPALLAGNTCVFKPSEFAPNVAQIMAEAFLEAGLPSGCLTIVNGGRDAGAALLQADVNGVLFTGSSNTGTAIHKMFAGRPDVILALEMGGNNPLIAWEHDDIATTVDTIATSAFITTGQRCSCARRLILPEGRFGDQVVEGLSEKIKTISIGRWDDPDAYMGSLINDQAAKRAKLFEADLIERGGKSVVGMQIMDLGDAFVTPGLIDMSDANDIPDEELFGPFLQVFRASSLEDAVTLANQTKYGLAGGLISTRTEDWAYARKHMRAGILNLNRPTTGAASNMPFGGPGLSGNARPGAWYAADYCAWPQASQVADR